MRYLFHYSLWKLVNRFTSNLSYSERKILERYVICMVNLHDRSEIRTKLVDELLSESFEDHENILEFIDVLENHKFPVYPILCPETEIHGNEIECGNFKKKFDKSRLELLSSIEDVYDFDIGSLALRYEYLIPQGQQWSMSEDLYDFIISKYDIQCECFSSPWNCTALRHPDRDIIWGSLFSDDEVFGSSGKFEELDVVGKNCIVNPPYIESMLLSAVEKCLDGITDNNVMFFFVPRWEDSEFYIQLSKSDKLQHIIPLTGSVKNVSQGKTIPLKFKVDIFVMSNRKVKTTKLEKYLNSASSQHVSKEKLYVYTDGSCIKNPGGPGGWAYVVYSSNGTELYHRSEGYSSTTNNRMEMLALLSALEDLKIGGQYSIHSDSQYCLNGITKQRGLVKKLDGWYSGWKKRNFSGTIKNLDLWHKIITLVVDHISGGTALELYHVKAHVGIIGNERADTLANEARIDHMKATSKMF